MPTQFIFDLDHTVIDSSHRQATLADGSLDLDHWIENNTPEKIMRDSLLPLSEQWKMLQAKGTRIIICTARVMQEADFLFLFNNGLHFYRCLSRPLGVTLGDGQLKELLLRRHAAEEKMAFARFAKSCVMFDDNHKVIDHLRPLGFSVYNAVSVNESLAKVA